MRGCRDVIAGLWNSNKIDLASNAGLVLARYLRNQREADGAGAAQEDRERLLAAAEKASSKAYDLYKEAYTRRRSSLHGTFETFKVNGRMIIGLGTDNVLETGLTLNPLFGTPMIPGSALKGLAAHYCSTIWGTSLTNGRDFKGPGGEYFSFIFGATEDAGFITFHDAWIKPESVRSSLVRDVMTPHHGDYYMWNNNDPQHPTRPAPTDFDDPNPVTFLSVSGEFDICVECEHDGSGSEKTWETLCMELLRQALEKWGVGGKTNGGYGRGKLSGASGAGNAANTVSGGDSGPAANLPAANSRVSGLVSLLVPGLKIQAHIEGFNKKGNPRFDVIFHDGKEIKISGRWDGTKRDWKKGDSVNVTVKGYSQNDNPPLVLTD